MAFLRAFLTILLTAVVLSSCKKSTDSGHGPSIYGYWKGKYGTGNTYPFYVWIVEFRSNGTVRVYNGVDNIADSAASIRADGTFTLTGSSVELHYLFAATAESYSSTAEVDTKYIFMEGSWGSGANTSDGGKFYLFKL